MVDASVGLKWVLEEEDSAVADALLRGRNDLVMPDFWLNEATNVLWHRVRRGLLTAAEARSGLVVLQGHMPPVATFDMGLHGTALEVALTTRHSVYDTLYVAFALAIGASKIVAADMQFVAAMRRHPNPDIAAMLLPLSEVDVGGST